MESNTYLEKLINSCNTDLFLLIKFVDVGYLAIQEKERESNNLNKKIKTQIQSTAYKSKSIYSILHLTREESVYPGYSARYT